MKRLVRDPMRFEVIQVFAEYGREAKVSLRSPEATAKFIERVRASVGNSLSNEALLHGVRTEAMFEALVASFGAVEILKHEDAGEVYVSKENLRIPDFRLVLGDDSQMLVEVKNFYQVKDAMQAFEVDGVYLDGLSEYSRIMRCRLLIAVYWARWNIWTLVPPEVFAGKEGVRKLSLLDAMKANHMAVLGDFSVGTRIPLSLIMHADKAKPRTVEADGSVQFTIGNVEVRCAGKTVVDRMERRIATYLMFYGKWEYEARPHVVDGELEAVEHRWFPAEEQLQEFAIVGSMSELFCNFYKFATQEEEQVRRVRIDVSPGSLGSLIPNDYVGKDLPLWRFKLQPSLPGHAVGDSPEAVG
jgi:hypothetical protein